MDAICLLSGGNIDVKTILLVVERGLIAGGGISSWATNLMITRYHLTVV